MAAESQRRENIIILFISGLLALNYPLLSIFDWPVSVVGIPLPYFYLFLVWVAIIISMAIILEKSGAEPRTDEQSDSLKEQ